MLTEQDKCDISSIMTAVLISQEKKCPNGIDKETAAELKAFAETWKVGRKTAIKAAITLVVGIFGTVIGLGLKSLLQK